MFRDWFICLLQYILPQHATSRLAGQFSRSKRPWLKRRLIDWFIRNYPVELSEAQDPEPNNYVNFESFFIRKLDPEFRPIDPQISSIVSPADGYVGQFGKVDSGHLIQAKGHQYTLYDLLGGYNELSDDFNTGHFMTIYLAPHNYHRVHMPVTGTLKEMQYIPGKLFSVQTATINTIPNIFARNERVITYFETEHGLMAMVLVGAVIVGSIHTNWQGQVTPTKPVEPRRWCYPNPKTPSTTITKGEEMGYFTLGSTVILLSANPDLRFDQSISLNRPLKFGEKIAEFMQPD